MSVDAAVATAVAETESAPTPKPRRRRKRSATKDQIKSAQTPLEKISKFHALCDANLVELEEEVRVLTNGLISGNSVFLCGAPGTAKSLMCDAISTLIGGRSYRKLMSKYTDVMELMGPFCPDALKRGVYEIKTDGYLPDADVAFLDEIWKSSSAILNTLLEIINEGTFTNGNQRIQVPLKLVVAASNEYPSLNTGSPLMAMYDRFVLRKNVEPVTKVRGIKQIAFNVIDLTVAEEDRISVDDLDVLRKTCATLPWSAEAKKQFGSAVGDCMKEGIEPSARRIKRAVSSCAADALLKGKSEVSVSDLGILQHILWVDPDPKLRAKVADIVGDLGDPAEREAREIEKTYSGLISKIQSASDNGEQLNLILDATKETSDLVNRALTLGLTEQAEHMKTSMAKIREEAFEKV